MFRLLSRVVVVSVVALSLNIAVVPAAEARPHQSGKAVSSATRSWTEEAMEWLNRILGTRTKPQTPKKMTAHSGPCIDPLGNPRPCP
jgi:hypothetical protein